MYFIKKYTFSLQQNVQVHDFNTRGKMDVHVLQCNTNIFKKSVVNTVIPV